MKRKKADVDYSPGHRGSQCGICVHYISGGSCWLVAGRIQPDYWCKLFVKMRGRKE